MEKRSPAYVPMLTGVGIATLFVPFLALVVFGPEHNFWLRLVWMVCG